MRSCKHGHTDGFMHIPCLECKVERLAGEIVKQDEIIRSLRGDLASERATNKFLLRGAKNSERYEWLRRGEGVMPHLGVTVCGKALDRACDHGMAVANKLQVYTRKRKIEWEKP